MGGGARQVRRSQSRTNEGPFAPDETGALTVRTRTRLSHGRRAVLRHHPKAQGLINAGDSMDNVNETPRRTEGAGCTQTRFIREANENLRRVTEAGTGEGAASARPADQSASKARAMRSEAWKELRNIRGTLKTTITLSSRGGKTVARKNDNPQKCIRMRQDRNRLNKYNNYRRR
jgi:hypothetical protein